MTQLVTRRLLSCRVGSALRATHIARLVRENNRKREEAALAASEQVQEPAPATSYDPHVRERPATRVRPRGTCTVHTPPPTPSHDADEEAGSEHDPGKPEPASDGV